MTIDSQLLERNARQHRQYGWSLVALRDKRPLTKSWPIGVDWSETLCHIRCGTATGIGLLLRPAGVCVLDKDEAREPGDRRACYGWMRRMGVARSTMEVETSGGVHFYFRLPDAVREVRSRIRLIPSLDVLMGDRYVAAAGSWRLDVEHRYAFRRGTTIRRPDVLPVLPDTVVEALNNDVHNKLDNAIAPIPVEADARLLRYVERIDRAVQGQGGSAACIRAMLKILSLVNGDMHKAWVLARHYNRCRCEPVFCEEREDGPDSLKRKLQEASRFWKAR